MIYKIKYCALKSDVYSISLVDMWDYAHEIIVTLWSLNINIIDIVAKDLTNSYIRNLKQTPLYCVI